MSLLTKALAYVTNTGAKAGQDGPLATTQKLNAAFVGLLANDVALSARMDALDAAQGYLSALPALVQHSGQVYSAKGTPWTKATVLGQAVSAANAVSPNSGNPGRFAGYIPLAGTWTYASTTVKLYVAVYAQSAAGLTFQVVAVSAAGVVSLGATLVNAAAHISPDYGVTVNVAGFEPHPTQPSFILRYNGSTPNDVGYSVTSATLAINATGGGAKPGSGFSVNYLPSFNGGLFAVGRNVGNGSVATLGFFAGQPAFIGTPRAVAAGSVWNLDVLTSLVASVYQPPAWASFPSGYGLVLHNARDVGGPGGYLAASLLTTGDRGVATVVRLRLSNFPSQGGFAVDPMSTTTARLEWLAPGASGALTRYATVVSIPTQAPGGASRAVNGPGVLALTGGSLLGVATYDTLNAYAVTADAANLIGLRQETLDPSFATAPNFAEGPAFTAPVGTAYDTAGFALVAATQAWPDVLLVGGTCGQAASGGAAYNGSAVHTAIGLGN